MKIAVIAPSFKDFMAFANSHCDTLGITDDEVMNISNGVISFKALDTHYLWIYTIFTSNPNPKLMLKYDTVVVLTNRLDKEMEECYDFLIERNPYAEQIRSDFKV